MTARELKYTYIEEAMSILDNEELMKKVLEAIRRCKKAIKNAKTEEVDDDGEDLMPGGVPALQFTREELIEHVNKSLQDIAEGRVYTSAEVHRRMEEKFPFLCK